MTQEEKLDLILKELQTHNNRGNDISNDIKTIKEKYNDLPCKNKDESKNPLFKINSIIGQQKIQWWFIAAVIVALLIGGL
jgi:hypothetical protein